MGTKQVRMQFQVAADDGVSAQVTVTAGGTQVFSGALAQTMNPIVPEDVHYYTEPFSLVEFYLDVADQTVPPDAANQYGQYTTPTDIVIAVSGGDICLQTTQANYSAIYAEVSPGTYKMGPGNVNNFAQLRFATQPVWTPTNTDPGRLIIDDNVDTGPGSLTIVDNQSVAYQVSMTLYSA
jgi:hypothetical protein